jgi:hypothetical protein
MTDPNNPPLAIPDAAETALALGNARHAIALTVAAELRRLAEDGTGWAIDTHLRARADELDGGA